MKVKFAFLSILFIFAITVIQAKDKEENPDVQNKKSERELRKSEQAAKDSISHMLAIDAIERSDYIFKITSINTQKGRIEYVNANVNFLLVEENMFTFQTSTGFGGGPNNMGGITTKGLVKDVNRSIDKHGNITYTFRLVSNMLNANVSLYIPSNSNSGDLYLNFDNRSESLTMFGAVYPKDSARLFEGGYM